MATDITGTPPATEVKDRADITVDDILSTAQEESDKKVEQTAAETSSAAPSDDPDNTNGEGKATKPLAPDEEILKALGGNQAAIERLDQQFKGLEKIRSDNESLRAIVAEQEALKPTIDVMLSYHDAFENPETVKSAAQKLVAEVAKAHNMTVEDLLELPDPDDTRPDYVKAGFTSPGELRAFKEAQEAKRLATEASRQQQPNPGESVTQIVDRVYTQLADQLAKDAYGFRPSKEQVVRAFEALPGVAAKDPVEAVGMFYSKEITRLAIEQTSKKDPSRFPEIGGGIDKVGVDLPKDRARLTVDDVLRMSGA